MASIRTRQDLLNPDRVFFRLIDDYANGRLSNDRNQIFHRAVVVAVDNIGGQLESSPPNPVRSVRARVYSSGMDATMPTSTLTIFHPFFPSHMLPPVEKDEHILVMFEDPQNFSNGLWLTTIPAYRNVNFRDPEEARPGQPTAANSFEGTSPPPVGGNNRDRAFGGTAEGDAIRDEVVSSFGVIDSPFKDKKILHIGGTYVSETYGNEIGVLAQQKGASSYNAVGRNNWGVFTWLRRRLGDSGEFKESVQDLVDRHSPDLVLITLGENDHQVVNVSDYKVAVEELFHAASRNVSRVIWVSPPKVSGRSSRLQPGIDLVCETIKSVVGSNYVESRDVTGETGRQSDGIKFTVSGAKNWARSVIDKIERSF